MGRIMALTYSEYLKLDELLSLQQSRSDGPEHDELLFIVTHQVYELWFKQLIHEIDRLCQSFVEGERPPALHTLKRLEKILKTLTQQVDVLETLTPLEFNSFRSYLETASGFQSAQFRELECLLGLREAKKLNNLDQNDPLTKKALKRFQQRSLWDTFLLFLSTQGYQIPQQILDRDYEKAIIANDDVQNILIGIYRDDKLTREICEALVDFDEGLQEWRYRHVKMVERTIGVKFGSGGSSGAKYLRETLFQPLWPDLWEIRSRL